MSHEEKSKLAAFDGREIRKSFHEGEWWFSITDVIEALVGGDRPRKYWNDLKKKLFMEGYDQLSEKIGQLKMKSSAFDVASVQGSVLPRQPCVFRRARLIIEARISRFDLTTMFPADDRALVSSAAAPAAAFVISAGFAVVRVVVGVVASAPSRVGRR